MGGPLTGVKVVDLTRVLAGPYCTMLLADMGAEVIKVERPGSGDDARAFGPFVEGESAYFMSLNRNKKSIVLDLKTEQGKAILQELIACSDVLVENFRPGAMKKLGFGYEEVQQFNPKLVYASCSGFGHTGPYSQKAAYDLIIQAMSGLMSITGHPGGPPTKLGSSIADIVAGMFTAIGIVSALYNRCQTGKGQRVDVAMLDSVVAILENAIVRHSITGEIPEPIGNRHPSITPFTMYETKDGYIVVAVGNDRLWEKFCKVTGQVQLLSNGNLQTNGQRTQRWDEIDAVMAGVFKKKTSDQWLTILDRAGIPVGLINNVAQMMENEQIRARDMIVKMTHQVAGEVLVPGVPVKFSATPGGVREAAPLLGEHSEEILAEWLGYSSDKIRELGIGSKE